MSSPSSSAGRDEDARAEPPRRGPLAWAVFVVAIAVVLAVMAGCMTVMYAPVFSGLGG
ncbi:hypothetical protein ACQEU5_01905 [Marinactinospora thermotolerans]|uniref:Uncharacterized protein n=1 Tax=Marinactinospora thermotolerans DSM 45154 TaxID=1122192 RepID=A0A1T4M4P5_9ACTN|nr:hypothetical protein [Marinactinospora thermotolerans]SJZ61847.1 hypothetical protein SAMN02745673_00944 [Marinactinospora thermotolerans DSM 45154]